MVGYRGISRRSGDEGTHMAEREGKGTGRNRRGFQRGALAGSTSQGTSRRETSDSKESEESRIGPAGRYSSAIMTRDELRRIITAYAECLDGLVSYPARFNIVERGKDGMYALHIMVGVRQRKPSLYNSLLAATVNAKPSTLCEFCGSELHRDSGKDAGISSTEVNSDEDIS